MIGEKTMLRHVMRPVYDFVPMQDFSGPWTDEFIESIIKPIERKVCCL